MGKREINKLPGGGWEAIEDNIAANGPTMEAAIRRLEASLKLERSKKGEKPQDTRPGM